MKKFLKYFPVILALSTLLLQSCEETGTQIVTCPDEDLLEATVKDDIYYDIFPVILNDILTDEQYLNVLQQTDSKLDMDDLKADLQKTGMHVDSLVLKDFEENNPLFADQQLDQRLETSKFKMLPEKEFQCLRANEQFDSKFPEKNKIVLLSVPGLSTDKKSAFIAYRAFCDTGCGDSYFAKLKLQNNKWIIEEKVKRP